MARRIGIFCTEGGTKSINGTQSRSTEFTLQLSTHGERCHLAKEVVIIYDFTFLVLFQIIKVFRCDLEHLTCTLTV